MFLVAAGTAVAAGDQADPLAQAIASPSRTEAFKARDVYRHPLETLRFFDVRPDQTVVEIWPGGGWYTEILAPLLRDHGKYYAAVPAPKSVEGKEDLDNFRKKLAADPGHYDKAVLTELAPPQSTEICPAGSADRILTFRNVHNWIARGYEQEAFNAFFKALKPGGVLGVEEHRAKPGTSIEQTKKSGYVEESYIKTLAANAGFKFAGDSPVNNNPKDTKDYPKGVWTLPPTLTLGEKDKARYLAIGESDRMTLKFIKPGK